MYVSGFGLGLLTDAHPRAAGRSLLNKWNRKGDAFYLYY